MALNAIKAFAVAKKKRSANLLPSRNTFLKVTKPIWCWRNRFARTIKVRFRPEFDSLSLRHISRRESQQEGEPLSLALLRAELSNPSRREYNFVAVSCISVYVMALIGLPISSSAVERRHPNKPGLLECVPWGPPLALSAVSTWVGEHFRQSRVAVAPNQMGAFHLGSPLGHSRFGLAFISPQKTVMPF